jgi:hypothetical protein
MQSLSVLTTKAKRTNPWLILCLPFAFCILHYTSLASAQQLLDRVLARIGIEAITQTDVRALVELGLVDAKTATDPAAVQQAIDRHLILKEVARFPPVEPDAAAIEQQLTAMKARVGARLEEVMLANGLDEDRLRGLARDTLRIRTYLEQRFGLSNQVGEQEARKYYEEHRDEFTRDGVPIPFEQVAAAARQRASAVRLQSAVSLWLQDLRSRSEVVLVATQRAG